MPIWSKVWGSRGNNGDAIEIWPLSFSVLHLADGPQARGWKPTAHRSQCNSPFAKYGSFGWNQGCSWFSRLLLLARGVICVATMFHWWTIELQTQNLPISFHLYGRTWSTSDWAFLLNNPNDFRCLRNVDILIEMPSSLVRNINISQCLNPSKK